MAFGGISFLRDPGITKGITKVSEMVGLLNKGSSTVPAASDDVADVGPISSNTLNVTRVGGVSSLIAAAGGAAMVLFNVNKTKDRAPIVVAAYLSVGLIVAASLITVAVIIVADIRARTSIATAVSPTVKTGRADVKYFQAAAGSAESAFSLDRAYDYVIVDATTANVVLTLPSCSSAEWQQMTIRRRDNSAHSVTVRPQGQEKIAGDAQRVIDRASPLQIYSDVTGWADMN